MTRAQLLAQRIEQGSTSLANYAQSSSESQRDTVIPPDGGKAVEGITYVMVAELNAKHAQDSAAVNKTETIALLRQNGRDAAEAVSAFTDADLDRAASVSLNAGATTLTAQFLIEDHAVRHSWHHLAKIKAVFNG